MAITLVIALVITQKAPAGQLGNLLVDELLFVKAVAQPLLRHGGVQAESAKDGLNKSLRTGAGSRYFSDHGISQKIPKNPITFRAIRTRLALFRALTLFSGVLMPRLPLICCAPSINWTAQTA